MDVHDYERLRAAFFRAFASVPEPLRSEIIVSIHGKPYTWESVFAEIKACTALSKKMLEQLEKFNIIE